MSTPFTKGDLPNYAFSLPFWMLDITNNQLILSKLIPGAISDKKNIVIVEQPIPGLNYAPVNQSGMGNRKIAFTIPSIKRNNTIGNVLLIKQWEVLRQKSFGITQIFTGRGQFTPNPKVVFNWGIGSIPLVWYVSNVDFSHRGEMVNQLGNPTFTDVNIELTLDEEDPVNKGEEIFRNISSFAGNLQALGDTFQPNSRTY